MDNADEIFRAAIISRLAMGLGAEDIALQTGYDLNDIRDEIKDLRKAGILNEIYGTAKNHGIGKRRG